MAVTRICRVASLWGTSKLDSWHFQLERLQLLIIIKGFTKGIFVQVYLREDRRMRVTWKDKLLDSYIFPQSRTAVLLVNVLCSLSNPRLAGKLNVFRLTSTLVMSFWISSPATVPHPAPNEYLNMVLFPKSGALSLTWYWEGAEICWWKRRLMGFPSTLLP